MPFNIFEFFSGGIKKETEVTTADEASWDCNCQCCRRIRPLIQNAEIHRAELEEQKSANSILREENSELEASLRTRFEKVLTAAESDASNRSDKEIQKLNETQKLELDSKDKYTKDLEEKNRKLRAGLAKFNASAKERSRVVITDDQDYKQNLENAVNGLRYVQEELDKVCAELQRWRNGDLAFDSSKDPLIHLPSSESSSESPFEQQQLESPSPIPTIASAEANQYATDATCSPPSSPDLPVSDKSQSKNCKLSDTENVLQKAPEISLKLEATMPIKLPGTGKTHNSQPRVRQLRKKFEVTEDLVIEGKSKGKDIRREKTSTF